MSRASTTQVVAGAPGLPRRVRERLDRLGLSVLQLNSDGRAAVMLGGAHPVRAIARSGVFAGAVRSSWGSLSAGRAGAVALWPGLTLISLPLGRQRRTGPPRLAQQLFAAVVLGPALMASEQFRAVCDAAGLDWQAAVARLDPGALVGDAEAARLAATLGWMLEDTAELDRRVGELQGLSEELSESYEELSLLYKLSTNMTVNQPPDRFLREACHELREVVGLKWMALQLTRDDPRLEALAGRTFTAGQIDSEPHVLTQIGLKLLDRFGREQEVRVVDDTRELGLPILPRLSSNLLVVPLRVEGKPLGVLLGGDKHDQSCLTTVDAKLCSSLASGLTIFIENMMLYEDMHTMFLGTLHALTSAIDAKDSYTHGHSERVALMSRMLAEAAGLDAHTVERVYLSGLVHDVGKIGVPESVLCKPGRLTDHEFRLIKLHPQIGGHILEDIRQMRDLLPGVLHHHERWDGRGYPAQLAGKDIPLFGRLIGLADAFDAMSSNRTYRRALSLQDVIDEIVRCRGQQFDPELAEVFVHLDFSPFFDLIAKHQDDAPKRRSA